MEDRTPDAGSAEWLRRQVEIGMDDPAQLYRESFAPHTHEDTERFAEMPHMHALDSDWSLTAAVPITAHAPGKVDVIELMEFRRLVTGMLGQLEMQAAATNLEELPVHEQQFLIIAMNIDVQLAQGLLQVTESMLADEGIVPPGQLQPVESSNIRSWGYVLEENEDGSLPDTGTLYVAFHGGSLYSYSGVPSDLVDQWIEAESVGGFFNGVIKKVGFEFKRLV